MKAQDLRIGNLVNTGNSIIKIDEIKTRNPSLNNDNFCGKYISGYGLIDISCLYGRYIEHLEPIPLTEELMNHPELNGVIRFVNNQCEVHLHDSDVCCLKWMIWNVDILFVHQLQNLYFALTGEELTIK